MRIFRAGMAILLPGAALVQVNGPAPFLWMAVYGAGALCSGLYTVGGRSARLSAVVSRACGLGAVYLMSRIVGNGTFLDETGTAMMGAWSRAAKGWASCSWRGGTGVLAWWGRRSRSDMGEES